MSTYPRFEFIINSRPHQCLNTWHHARGGDLDPGGPWALCPCTVNLSRCSRREPLNTPPPRALYVHPPDWRLHTQVQVCRRTCDARTEACCDSLAARARASNGESARRSVFANLMLLINCSRPAYTPVFFVPVPVWGRQAARSNCSVATSAFLTAVTWELINLIRRVSSTDCLLTFRFIFYILLITFSASLFFRSICFL